MSVESMNGELNMGIVTDALREREHLFVPVTLAQSEIFCGDEREPVGYVGQYIRVFGGLANTSYNLAVMKETTGDASNGESFADATASLVPVLSDEGVRAGIHSAEEVEAGSEVDPDIDDDIDCGYVKKRGPISEGIVVNADGIIEEAKELRPELFREPESAIFARKVTEGHKALAEHDGFLGPSREVARKAIEKGAPSMVVKGQHVGKVGFINLVRNSTLDSGKALSEGIPAYNHDQWAVLETFQKLHSLYPYDATEYDIATTIDAIGTMKALGVEEIIVRR